GLPFNYLSVSEKANPGGAWGIFARCGSELCQELRTEQDIPLVWSCFDLKILQCRCMALCAVLCGSLLLPSFSGLSDHAPVRVEPKTAPNVPAEVVFHPKDPSTLLVVDEQGVSLWNFEDPVNPERRLTLRTETSSAAFLSNGRSIATADS